MEQPTTSSGSSLNCGFASKGCDHNQNPGHRLTPPIRCPTAINKPVLSLRSTPRASIAGQPALETLTTTRIMSVSMTICRDGIKSD
jgi:hypothetical protein